jgi:MoaA/NifB/PqqE/SkfB family radical SAM enzyme
MANQIGINLSVARSCFVRCDGCYNHFGRVNELAGTDVIVAFLDRAHRAGVGKVTLCGGDPLARPDILPLLEHIKELGFVVNLDTVGTPLLGAVSTVFYGRRPVPRVEAGSLARLVDLIGIPVDGANNATVATFRTGRADLLDEQQQVLRVLDGDRARVCVNTVVHRQNIAEVPSIFPLICRYPCVVKWQLFQFSPTGPLGFRNRDGYLIDEDSFLALDAHLCDEAAARHWSGDIELKTNARRRDAYVLVDSEGLAWQPNKAAATDRRVIVGDIKRPEDHARILDAVLRLRRPRVTPTVPRQVPRRREDRQSVALDV